MPLQIHESPPGAGQVVLGVTLPALLDEAVAAYPNPRAFNQPDNGGWRTLSNAAFRTIADEIALGLLEIGVERGSKVAFFMESDLHFALADFACLISGAINVPLYLTSSPQNLAYVTNHAEAEVMFVSNAERLFEAATWIGDAPGVHTVVVADGEAGDDGLPRGLRLLTVDGLRSEGRARAERHPEQLRELRAAIDPHDLATLIYTSGTTGPPKGVMLTHENISSNVYAAITGLPEVGHQEEVALNFLPLTHIYARMLSFASVAWGHQVFYSNPDRLVEDLPAVRPTMFATVPRVLEKVFDRILLGIQEARGPRKKIGSWAIELAQQYEIGRPRGPAQKLQHRLADRLVYSKLRERLGLTRIKAVSSGGAALRPDLANAFAAMGIPVLQGYGLTETSPVITNSTPESNRPGTVGQPIAGVEVAIADDGEILTRGPHVMKGYYKDAAQTRAVLDDDGWFHTGDIGEFTPDGFLRITDRKKALFKLSTGKDVVPQPVEARLMESPLIEQAVVIGAGQKFCTALLFPNLEAVRLGARGNGAGADLGAEELLRHPAVVAEFERLVDRANRGMDPWSQVKRFRLVPELMDVESGLLTPTMKVKRRVVLDRFSSEIEQLYRADVGDRTHPVAIID